MALAAALFSGTCAALDPPLQINQYAHTSWTARDGATLGQVLGMAQTPDGYLWIAGSFGLFRFDGQRFMKWEPPDGQKLPSGPYSLLASRDGTLWIGTFGGLSSWNGRQFVRRHQAVGDRFVGSLLEDREGTVWATLHGEPGRVCALRAGQGHCEAPPGGFGRFAWGLVEDRAGNLWLGADNGLWRWKPGAPKHYPMPGLRVGELTTTVGGGVLVGIHGRGLLELVGDRLVPHRFHRIGKPNEWLIDGEVQSNQLLRDREGGLWIATESRGLIHVKDGQADVFTRSDGLSGNVGNSLFEDHEGTIWFGSDKGLDRFRKLPVSSLSTRQGLPDDLTNSVLAAADGSVWVATNDGLARWTGARPIVYKQRDGLPDAHVHAQYQDAEGRLWVSTARGLAYFDGKRFVPVGVVPSTEIHAITGDAKGNLWVSGNKGLTRLYRGRPVEQVAWNVFGDLQVAQGIVSDGAGLWVGFWRRAVSYFKDGKVQATYTPAQGLGGGLVTGLRLGADGAVWATTAGGISRIKDGRVMTLSAAQGLPCDMIHSSMQDDAGALWMYTSCGLLRVAPDELAAWVADPSRRVRPTLWGAADGVPLNATPSSSYNPPVAKDAQGKLWFVGSGEVQLVDPAQMHFNPVPPPVHIVTLVVDQKAYAVANGLRLPPLARDIRFEFSALTLVDPKSTRFRYRLEGHDTDWQEVVDRRLASYTNLPPGNYRFQVKAANNSGVWNEEGAELAFSIEPALYQKTWVRVTAAAVLLGLGWGAFRLWLRLRLRRMQRQFEATLEARVAERTRIARDLHDTLLQHFHGLLLQFQAACNLLPDRPRESRQILTSAIDHAAAAITEGRDTVQGLRASAVQADDLAQELRALAAELAREGGGTTVARVEVQGRPRPLQPTAREEIARIAGEALRNAFRHAHARRIDVEIRHEARRLRVTVSDDGQGIDAGVLREGGKAGHFGLSGMRERAELLGGELSVRSDPGAGTEVALSVAAPRAYLAPAPVRRWGRSGAPAAGSDE